MVNKTHARQQRVNIMFRIFLNKGLLNQADYHAFCRKAKVLTDTELVIQVYKGLFK